MPDKKLLENKKGSFGELPWNNSGLCGFIFYKLLDTFPVFQVPKERYREYKKVNSIYYEIRNFNWDVVYQKIHELENSNYLFVDIDLSEVKTGDYKIVFSNS